jgi:6-bladed beta-propeller
MMKQSFLLICFAMTFITPAAAEVVKIHCPTDPPSVRRVQLQERWRIDSEDPESPLLGYFFESQILAHEGFVYLLDQQLCHILVYSDDGEYIKTLMREGDGPGEIRNPSSMILCTGDRLGVLNGYPSKLEFVDLDGNPRGSWRLQANAWLSRVQETPKGWYCVYQESKQSSEPGVFDSVLHAAFHDDEGQRTEEFFSQENHFNHRQNKKVDEADEYQPWHKAAALADGQVVLVPARDEYGIEWRNLAGEVTRSVARDFPAHRRTQSELDEMKSRSYSISYGDIKFSNRKLCENDPVISSIQVLTDGSLRVRTSLFDKDLPENMVCRYEVHEPNGQLRELVEIYDTSGYFDLDYDAIALLEDGRAVVLRNVKSASRAATDPNLHPEVQKLLPPIPDERDDIVFTPIMCDLVPYTGD